MNGMEQGKGKFDTRTMATAVPELAMGTLLPAATRSSRTSAGAVWDVSTKLSTRRSARKSR